MPTIEIVSLNRKKKIKISKGEYPFWIRQERELHTDRYIYHTFLNQKDGIMLHLGNLGLQKNGFFYASDLIDWDYEKEEGHFQFATDYMKGIQRILGKATNGSPIKRSYFLTDIQGEDVHPRYIQSRGVKEFWQFHDEHGLQWNTLYEIHETNGNT